ncbi:hypothetical protein BD311DRAFT_66043 [Dichomitus squalens]|uniref:DUF6533 domain-containing protein n=1 Tax=Dichomitus squalens TaxID=114155 RepID=A0A4Q9MB70_9APHY|nr:hypothetical protein BD311DRAFT_66043 [Dichomitus squalens]
MSSSGADDSVGSIINLIASNFVQACGDYSVFVLICYDHFITFDREVNFFWKGKLTGAGILFFCNRYLGLVNYALQAFSLPSPTLKVIAPSQVNLLLLSAYRYICHGLFFRPYVSMR